MLRIRSHLRLVYCRRSLRSHVWRVRVHERAGKIQKDPGLQSKSRSRCKSAVVRRRDCPWKFCSSLVTQFYNISCCLLISLAGIVDSAVIFGRNRSLDERNSTEVTEKLMILACDDHSCLTLALDLLLRSHIWHSVHILDIKPCSSDSLPCCASVWIEVHLGTCTHFLGRGAVVSIIIGIDSTCPCTMGLDDICQGIETVPTDHVGRRLILIWSTVVDLVGDAASQRRICSNKGSVSVLL